MYDYDPSENGEFDYVEFAQAGSAQRDPRNLPCPTCGAANALTLADVARHYQCDRCADAAEGKFGGEW